jgi:hypothetical protein
LCSQDASADNDSQLEALTKEQKSQAKRPKRTFEEMAASRSAQLYTVKKMKMDGWMDKKKETHLKGIEDLHEKLNTTQFNARKALRASKPGPQQLSNELLR